MGEQSEKRNRPSHLHSRLLLFRTVHDTGCGINDSSKILFGM